MKTKNQVIKRLRKFEQKLSEFENTIGEDPEKLKDPVNPTDPDSLSFYDAIISLYSTIECLNWVLSNQNTDEE